RRGGTAAAPPRCHGPAARRGRRGGGGCGWAGAGGGAGGGPGGGRRGRGGVSRRMLMRSVGRVRRRGTRESPPAPRVIVRRTVASVSPLRRTIVRARRAHTPAGPGGGRRSTRAAAASRRRCAATANG